MHRCVSLFGVLLSLGLFVEVEEVNANVVRSSDPVVFANAVRSARSQATDSLLTAPSIDGPDLLGRWGAGTEIGTALLWDRAPYLTTIRAWRTSQLRYFPDKGAIVRRP